MTHTPGPWEARPNIGRVLLNGSNAYDVREIFNEQGGWNPDDIRLMAAAPELYAACLALRACLADWIDIQDRDDARNEGDKALEFAAAAIAKAEGRSE